MGSFAYFDIFIKLLYIEGISCDCNSVIDDNISKNQQADASLAVCCLFVLRLTPNKRIDLTRIDAELLDFILIFK